jgi:hypothetical protein
MEDDSFVAFLGGHLECAKKLSEVSLPKVLSTILAFRRTILF